MKTINNHFQSGFALIMSLLILIILTIMGLSSSQSSRMEVAMAGNLRESSMALQVAEMGLRTAETYIADSSREKTDFNDTNGLFSISSDKMEPDFFTPSSWDKAQVANSLKLDTIHAKSKPKYFIKYLGDNTPSASGLSLSGYGSQQDTGSISYFRITSKGGGQTEHGNRILQTYFAKAF